MHNKSRLLVHDYQALVFIDDVYRYLLRLYVELAWRICQLYGNLVEWLDCVVGLHRLAVHQHGLRLGGFLYAVARCVRHAVHKVLVDADWVYPFIYCEVVMLVLVGEGDIVNNTMSFSVGERDVISLSRIGSAKMSCVFERGKRYPCTYELAFGAFDLVISSQCVDNSIDYENGGEIYLKYVMESRGIVMQEAKYRLTVEKA